MGLIYVPVSIRRVEGGDSIYEAPFLVDTGATDSLASASQLDRIGVRVVGRKAYELADGARQEYAFGFVLIELMGEITAGRILFGPDDVDPLLGVTALESMGFVVDPVAGALRRLPAIPLKAAARSRRRLPGNGQRAAVASSGIRATFTVSCTAGE